jgi:predicted transcriptional regulator
MSVMTHPPEANEPLIVDPDAYLAGALRLDDETERRLAVISLNEGRTKGDLIRRAVRRHYNLEPLRQNADAPWVNRRDGAEHG